MKSFFTGLLLLVLLAGYASAAAKASTYQDSFELMWTADLNGEVHHVRLMDLNGDGMGEVVADSIFIASGGRSGTLFGLDKAGQQEWKFMAALLRDSYTTKGGYTILGSGPSAMMVSPDGHELWERSTRDSQMQMIYSQSVYADDIDKDGKDEVLIGNNLGSKGSTLVVRDNNGEELADISFRGMESPNALSTADLNGDGIHEILVGTLKYSVNTVTESHDPAYGKPATFTVYDIKGAIKWSVTSESAVTAVEACDVDKDGTPEVIVGSTGKVAVYNYAGSPLWSATVAGMVGDLDCGDVNGDGYLDVAVAAGNTYVLKNTGEELWTYAGGSAAAVRVVDLGGDGKPEVISTSNSLRVLDSEGKLLYKTETFGRITSLDVGDLNDDTYDNIVFGSMDHKLRALDTKKYGQQMSADGYLSRADKAYASNDYNLTAYMANEAYSIYGILGDDAGKTKAKALVDKSVRFTDGDRYYNLTLYYYGRGEYNDAVQYAQKSIDEYNKVKETRRVGELNELKKRAETIPLAQLNMNLTRQYYAEGSYQLAIDSASKAKAAYALLNDTDLVEEADGIQAKAGIYIEFSRQLDIAYNYSQYNNYGNATYHLSLAEAEYTKLNDTRLKPQLENISDTVHTIKRSENVIIYGGVTVVVLILLLTLTVIALIVVYIRRQGGFKRLEYALKKRDAEDKGGLRQLRGKTGESIGDSFKR